MGSVFFSVPSRSTENLKMVDAAVQEKLEAGFAKLQAADNYKSLLKKYLTREVLDKTKDLKTSFGSTLLDVVQSGMENLDSGVGVYAPDAESYTLFHDLFDPIIEDYHTGFKSETSTPPATSEMSRLWATWTPRVSSSSRPACVAAAPWRVTPSTPA